MTLTNTYENARKVSLLAYNGHEMDGMHILQGYNTGAAYYDSELQGVILKSNMTFDGEKHRGYYGYTTVNLPPDGYDATENAFVGPYGSLAHPKALVRGGCTNNDGVGEKLAAALQKDLVLKPKESVCVIFVCGVAFTREKVLEIRNNYTPEQCEKSLNAVREKFANQISLVSISTPDEKLNEMFPWLKHQTNMGSRWARVRSNGYRDMLSDTDCLACFNPVLALERFERIW